MTTVVHDSRATIPEPGTSPYVSSESGATQLWGQPPATHYVFTIRDSVIIGIPRSGIYAEAMDIATPQWPDSSLLSELAIWELASDRDLQSFERDLD